MSAPVIGPAESPDLHVMSFNVQRAMEGSMVPRRDRWSVRAPAFFALLRSEQPTIVGLQEALPRAMQVVNEALGPHHRALGRGRGRRGMGEGNPLVYDSERLELRSWEQRALSDRPHVPGSRTWGNLLPRVMVWAEFSDRSTGARFRVVNTHLDPLSPRSRRRSADAILASVRRSTLPTVVLGDLNAGPASPTVDALVAGGRLLDTWSLAERRTTPRWGTFAGHGRARLSARRIDWLFVTPGVRVREVGVNARSFDGVRPSDHLALQALLRIEEKTA